MTSTRSREVCKRYAGVPSARDRKQSRGPRTRSPEFPVRRGSVLILALWTLFFLASLAVAVGAHVSSSLRLAEALRNNHRGFLLAQAGLVGAIRELAADTNGWDAAGESWNKDEARFREIPLGEGTYSVSCIDMDSSGRPVMRYGLLDEERKVNLNLADTNLLVSFFSIVGHLNRPAAAELVGSMGRYWTMKNERAAKDQQLTAKMERGYVSNHDSIGVKFEVLNEFLLVSGVTPELYDRVEPYCTVHGNGKVNINTAPMEVLQALMDAGSGGDQREDTGRYVSAIIGFREAGHVFELRGRGMEDLRSSVRSSPDAAVLDAALIRMRGLDIGVRSSCFRGTVAARVMRHASDDARIEFVYDRENGAAVSWRRL